MRFRATVKDTLALSAVLQSLERMAATCVMHLTKDSVRLYLTTHFTQGEQAFVDLSVKHMFDDFKIESKSNNEIPFLINLPNLARAVKSGERASRMTWKLSKKRERAYLAIEIIDTVNIKQDVPVSLQGLKKTLEEHQEPSLPEPDVQVRLPSLTSLKTVVDRMRAVSAEITIEATSVGEVTLQVKTDMVQIRTFYKNLCLLPDQASARPKATVRACLDIRKLYRVLQCRLLPTQYVLACIVRDHAFVVFAKLKSGRGGVTYYIPIIENDDAV